MIGGDGWLKYCIWEHSATVWDLYRRRCLLQAEEMTCAAQAAELFRSRVAPGDTLLDAGCGSGYFYHSLQKRGIPAQYYGIDGAPTLIGIGRRYMPQFGLPADHLTVVRLEDLDASADHVLCMNVLSNIDNYHRPLERLLQTARKSVILRESLGDTTQYLYVKDKYLDEGCDLKVHVNTYALSEVSDFIRSYGFRVTAVMDERTLGQPELVIDYPHHWCFLVAEREVAS